MGVAFFMGDHDKRIDAKRRVLVPGEFRAALGPSGSEALVVVPEPNRPYLRAQSVEEFQAILRQLKSTHGRFSAQRAKAARHLFGRARTLPFDPGGRIVLPQKFCDHARLEQDVTFVGCGDHIEIWSTALLEADYVESEEDAQELLEGLEAMGPEGVAE